MASALLRRRLAHNISFAQRRLLSSTPSVLAQEAAAPQGPSATTRGGKRHIAEDLGGVSASEILAETGTRKDAQMRHFTGDFFSFCFRERFDLLTICPHSKLRVSCFGKVSPPCTLQFIVMISVLNIPPRTVCSDLS